MRLMGIKVLVCCWSIAAHAKQGDKVGCIGFEHGFDFFVKPLLGPCVCGYCFGRDVCVRCNKFSSADFFAFSDSASSAFLSVNAFCFCWSCGAASAATLAASRSLVFLSIIICASLAAEAKFAICCSAGLMVCRWESSCFSNSEKVC